MRKETIVIVLLVFMTIFSVADEKSKKEKKDKGKISDFKKDQPDKSILAIDHEHMTIITEQNKTFSRLPKNLTVKPEWWYQFKDSKVIGVWIVNDTIYVQNDSFFLYALDIKTGMPRWIRLLTFKVEEPPVEYDNGLYFVSGIKIIKLYKVTGKRVFEKKVNKPIVVRPGFTSARVYTGTVGGEIRALWGNNLGVVWTKYLKTTISAPITLTDLYVLAPCSNGMLYAFDLSLEETGDIAWRFKANEAILVPPLIEKIFTFNESDKTLKSATRIYLGSIDRNVYCLNSTGSLMWYFPTNGRVMSQAMYGKDKVDEKGNRQNFSGNVFVIPDKDGIYAIKKTVDPRKETPEEIEEKKKKRKKGEIVFTLGTKAWRYPDAVSLVGMVDDEVFVWSKNGKLVGLKQFTGEVTGEWELPDFKTPIRSDNGNYIYMLSNTNEIFCFGKKQ